MTLTDSINFDKWVRETNPTNEERLARLREISLHPTPDPVQEVELSNAWGLEDNYQGLGNGNYTMEEYSHYELQQQDIK